MNIYTPYCYLIGWSKFNTWYYGCEYSKTTKIAHPTNLWTTYFTSSKYVKKFRTLNGEPDIIQVRKIFKTAHDATEWEHKVCRRLNVKDSTIWLNQHNGGNDFMFLKNKGAKRACPERLKLFLRELHLGKPKSEEAKLKMRLAKLGGKQTPEHVENNRKAITGLKRSEKTREKMRNFWKTKPFITCPHCNFTAIESGNMYRWHFENCKKKGMVLIPSLISS